jgi:hypothetical protein
MKMNHHDISEAPSNRAMTIWTGVEAWRTRWNSERS